MPPTLEDITQDKKENQFRSEGERRIARTLEEYDIAYLYEKPLVIQYQEKRLCFRPDFYLPEHNTYVEYFGYVGHPDYDKRTEYKKAAYAANHIRMITLYPWDLIQGWPNHLLDQLRRPSTQTYRMPPQPYTSTARLYARAAYRTRPQPYRPRTGIRYR